MPSDIFPQALLQAGTAILSGDAALWEIILLSFRVSLSALLIALLIGLPLALLLAVYRFRGRFLLRILVDSFMAFPPVVVGLLVFLMLARNGPLGVLGLLYTPTAMIIAQAALITPIIIALASQHFEQHWQRIREQFVMLGFSPWRCSGILLGEARFALVTVVLAAFGRAIAEIGAVMVVGGNIAGQTRVMTTAIAMETRQGNLAMALALGMVLIVLALLINLLVHFVNQLQADRSRVV